MASIRRRDSLPYTAPRRSERSRNNPASYGQYFTTNDGSDLSISINGSGGSGRTRGGRGGGGVGWMASQPSPNRRNAPLALRPQRRRGRSESLSEQQQLQQRPEGSRRSNRLTAGRPKEEEEEEDGEGDREEEEEAEVVLPQRSARRRVQIDDEDEDDDEVKEEDDDEEEVEVSPMNGHYNFRNRRSDSAQHQPPAPIANGHSNRRTRRSSNNNTNNNGSRELHRLACSPSFHAHDQQPIESHLINTTDSNGFSCFMERPLRSCRISSNTNLQQQGQGLKRPLQHPTHTNSGKRRRIHSHHRRDRSGSRGGGGHSRSRSSSSTSSSSSSSSSNDQAGIKSARHDLKQEQRFERRKIKSMAKGRQQLMPINLVGGKSRHPSLRHLSTAISSNNKMGCADIDPMQVDTTVGFSDIGGLTHHIQSLKEVVILPMLYPDVFQRFNTSPPKGVLFYGPPGTGKTLVARALANECSKGGQKVAFFMRKGADCLSKWVGESERQLRLLFDQAYNMRPSIIFFDEIDGLAPVRSSRQDQIHSSIVSTLLALMDGLDKRGEIIVIGATNRLDSIDPALRRPGRFDRELRFDLPDQGARTAILSIHTRKWEESKPDPSTMEWLAASSGGYCGADLKGLCTEAVLIALRERFPHIYLTNEKLAISHSSLSISRRHFEHALQRIVPAARRDLSINSQQLQPRTECFFGEWLEGVMRERVPSGYGRRLTAMGNDNVWESDDLRQVVMALQPKPTVPSARLLVYGPENGGQTTHYLPLIVHRLDHLPVFSVSCGSIFSGLGSPEEHLSQVMRSALRAAAQGSPALLLMPDIDVLEKTLPTALWNMLVASLQSFVGFTSVLVLASARQSYESLSDDLRVIFRRQCSLEICPPTEEQRRQYFHQLMDKAKEEPLIFNASDYPSPMVAPPVVAPIRKMSSSELKRLIRINEQMQRQFRIFLRDLLGKLVRERRFSVFSLPVDEKDAEDYYQIIREPMSLSQMMSKIDAGAYATRKDFMQDIILIRNNAIEYNPDKTIEDKTIRHNSKGLFDMAEMLFEMELDEEFEEQMEETARLTEEAKMAAAAEEQREEQPSTSTSSATNPAPPPPPPPPPSVPTVPTNSPVSSSHTLLICRQSIMDVVEAATLKTDGWSVPDIECLGAELTQQIDKYRSDWNRQKLPRELKEIVAHFQL